MILIQETIEKFNYNPDLLSRSSTKKVCVKCDYCNNIIEISKNERNKRNKIVQKDCCRKCKNLKAEDVNLVKYGVKNQFERDKAKATSSEWIQSEEFKKKSKKTNLEKYGVENAIQNKEIKDKQIASLVEHYGVKNPSQSKEIKEKIWTTNLRKYGNKNFLGSEEGKRKSLDGIRLKYGVINVFQNNEIKEKSRASSVLRFGVTHHLKVKDRALKNAQKVLQSKIANGNIKLYDGKTISEWRSESQYSDSRFRYLIDKYGFEEARKMEPYQSSIESIISSFLDENKIEYKQRKIVGRYRPDFIVGDVIIEVDGLYWHCDAVCEDSNYHVNKRAAYIGEGYSPLFFRENEIEEKLLIVKSIINNKLKMSNKLFARKLEIREVEYKDGSEFIKQNHLMGTTNNVTISYGLYLENELYSILQLKRISNENYDVSRFCNKLNYSITGGFSKLLSHFKKTMKPKSIQTFIDLRYGTGEYLKALGFAPTTCYKSFVWTDGNKVFHRLAFRSNTGYKNRLFKLWDCGQAKFVMTCR